MDPSVTQLYPRPVTGGLAGWVRGLSADQVLKLATAAVVLAVATFAAIVSYSHIFDLGRVHGQSGTAARLLPLSVDGLIVAAGLVMLYSARQGATSGLARCMLWLGILATIGANVAYGLRYGTLGAVVSAWPAVAFIGSAEMALGMVRSSAGAVVTRLVTAVPEAGNSLAAHLAAAAELFGDEVAAGAVPTVRRIRSELGVGQAKATQARAHLAVLAGQAQA